MDNNKVVSLNKNEIIKNENDELSQRIEKLRKYIENNMKEINRLSLDSSDDEIIKVNDHFNKTSQNLTNIEEIISDMDLSHSKEIYLRDIEYLQRMYRNMQNIFYDKKIEISTSKITSEYKLKMATLNTSVAKAVDETNKITENLLLSVISILLGVSLVTSMITGLEKLEPKHMLSYFTSICWIAIIVIGFAYILIRQKDEKTKYIVISMVIVTIILTLVLWLTFF